MVSLFVFGEDGPRVSTRSDRRRANEVGLSLVLPLLQDGPPGSVHHGGPEADPGQREDDHADRSAHLVEHELAEDQRHEKDQDPTPEGNPLEFAGLLFLILSNQGSLLTLLGRLLLFALFLAFGHSSLTP
jgi:hypothetical protein